MSIRSTVVAAALLALLTGASAAARAQDSLAAAKELYAAAAYEDALKMLERLEGPATVEHSTYRAFCLIALDRMAEAEKVVEQILLAEPLFAPKADETSPRVQALFDKVRTATAPAIARTLFTDGKAAYERKEREVALQKFELLLQVIERSGAADNTMLGEMKLLASGYVDLARAAAPAGPPPSAAAPGAGAAAPPVTNVKNGDPANANGSDRSGANRTATANRPVDGAGPAPATDPSFTAAVPISETFPPYDPKFIGHGLEFSGVLRVRISAAGRVDGAEIVETVHPQYDRRLLQAALNWRYQPARRQGAPVASERLVAVQLKR